MKGTMEAVANRIARTSALWGNKNRGGGGGGGGGSD